MTFAWKPEHIDRLKTLYAEELSCSKIAAELGVTRNAVIGKVHRLNLPRRGPMKPPPRVQQAPSAKRIRIAKPPRFPEEKFELPVIDIEPLNLSFAAIGNAQCRWIVSEPNASTLFCGHGAVGPWCPAHRSLVYRPWAPKARVAA